MGEEAKTPANLHQEAELLALRDEMQGIAERARALTYLAHEAVMSFERLCLKRLEWDDGGESQSQRECDDAGEEQFHLCEHISLGPELEGE